MVPELNCCLALLTYVDIIVPMKTIAVFILHQGEANFMGIRIWWTSSCSVLIHLGYLGLPVAQAQMVVLPAPCVPALLTRPFLQNI